MTMLQLQSVLMTARRSECSPRATMETPGLDAASLGHLASTFRFDAIASAFPHRGRENILRRIAWHGSVLADVASSDDGSEYRAGLELGALFNLGVALFDTCVETGGSTADALTEALHPTRLLARLEYPDSCEHALGSETREVDLVCRLFDQALALGGRLIFGLDHKRRTMADLLERMYLSEIGVGACRSDAKALPVYFICTAADCVLTRGRALCYMNLGRLMALFDDWQDLGEDRKAGRANSFVYPYDMRSWRCIPYVARAAAGAAYDWAMDARRVRQRLTTALQKTFDESAALDTRQRAKLGWFLENLLGAP